HAAGCAALYGAALLVLPGAAIARRGPAAGGPSRRGGGAVRLRAQACAGQRLVLLRARTALQGARRCGRGREGGGEPRKNLDRRSRAAADLESVARPRSGRGVAYGLPPILLMLRCSPPP